MTSVKTFRVIGEFAMGRTKTVFRREIRAVRGQDAVERVLQELGSRHGVRRRRIKIVTLEELPEESAEVGEPAED